VEAITLLRGEPTARRAIAHSISPLRDREIPTIVPALPMIAVPRKFAIASTHGDSSPDGTLPFSQEWRDVTPQNLGGATHLL